MKRFKSIIMIIVIMPMMHILLSVSILKEERMLKVKRITSQSELQEKANGLVLKKLKFGTPSPFLTIRNYRYSPSISDSLYRDLLRRGIKYWKAYTETSYDFLIDSILTNRILQYIYPNIVHQSIGGIRLFRYFYLFEKHEHIEDVLFYYHCNGQYYYSNGLALYSTHSNHFIKGILESDYEYYFLLPTLELGAIFGVKQDQIFVFTRYQNDGEYCPYYWVSIEKYRELFEKYIYPRDEYEQNNFPSQKHSVQGLNSEGGARC